MIPPVPLSSCVKSDLLLILKMRMIPPTEWSFLSGSEDISYVKAASMVPDLIVSLSPTPLPHSPVVVAHGKCSASISIMKEWKGPRGTTEIKEPAAEVGWRGDRAKAKTQSASSLKMCEP